VVADVSQAGTGDEADITGAEDRDTQGRGLILLEKVSGSLPDERMPVKQPLEKT
jgi:hypothetical protein